MTNEERIKADAERYAGLMVWVNTSNDPDREPLFHEHISSASYIAGATAEHDRAKVLVDALEFVKNNGLCSEATEMIDNALEQWKSGKGKEVKPESQSCPYCGKEHCTSDHK